MESRVTTPIFMLLLFLFGAGSGSVFAQDKPQLEDEFIVFVNGPNILIPESDAEVVNDPLNPASGNKVAKFSYGNWAHSGFRWSRDSGVDASALISENPNEGATLFFRLLSDPANAGQANVWIMFTDKTDDSGAARADLEAGTATADHEFRAIWEIPQEFHDGMWHDVEIPLPPATAAVLESAKGDGTLDGLAANWSYPGAWSNGAFGIGPGFGTDTNDPLWREFEWDAVKNFGVMWDNNTGGGPLYIDNMYFGDSNTDISVASDPPSAMSGVTGAANGPANVVSWTPQAEFGGYNIYVSATPITDVSANGVQRIATKAFNAASFQVEHEFEVPHPSLAPLPLYYAVTSLSQFGVENPDVSNSAVEIANGDLAIQPYILQLTEDEGNMLFDNLVAGVASSAGFPDELQPFTINQARQRAGDVATLPASDADLSANIIMGYTDFNELFIYAEVIDDVLEFGGENSNGTETWQWDAIEMGWGNYDVRFIPNGGLLVGSPHQDFMRGNEPDYQFRFAPFDDAAGNFVGTSTFVSTLSTPENEGEIQGGGSVFEKIIDGGGNVIGYKMLTLVPLDAIQFSGTGDVVLDPPATDEIRLVPMNIALSDADGNQREHQVLWSTKGNAGANWWNTPNQWLVVAMAGRATAVDTEDEEQPVTFLLEQNYPNPFNPATQIRFSLGTSEQVTLSVFDVLGRKVATLVDGQRLAAGTHTVAFDASNLASGVYLYRLNAGTSYTQTRRMMLVK